MSEGSVENLVTATNTGQWAFNIHGQFSIAFAILAKGEKGKTQISGPFFNKLDFLSGRDSGAEWENEVLLKLTESSAFPNLGNQKSADILTKMREAPSLNDWRDLEISVVQEVNSNSDRHHFDHQNPNDPVQVISGRGFNIWNPSTGEVFAESEYQVIHAILLQKLQRQTNLKSSAFYGLVWPQDFDGSLPFEKSRIALRALTNPTNTRTTIPVLMRPRVILPDTAPYLFAKDMSATQESLILATMSSLIFDWYSRKFIESKMMTHFINSFPVPEFYVDRIRDRAIFLSGSLAAVDENYAEWASEVGVPVGTLLQEDERNKAIFELDAVVAIAYGLNEAQVTHIFETFHRGWDYKARLEKVLEYFEKWGGEK